MCCEDLDWSVLTLCCRDLSFSELPGNLAEASGHDEGAGHAGELSITEAGPRSGRPGTWN